MEIAGAHISGKILLLGGAALAVLIFLLPRGGSVATSDPTVALANLQAQTAVALGQQQTQAYAAAQSAESTRAQLAAALQGKQMDTSLQAAIAAASALNTRAGIAAQGAAQQASLDAGIAQAHIYADTASAISLNQAATAKALAPIYVNGQLASQRIAAGVSMNQAANAYNPYSYHLSPAQQASSFVDTALQGIGGAVKLAPQISSLFGGGSAASGAVNLGSAAAGALPAFAGDSFSAAGDAASLAANTIPDAAVASATTGAGSLFDAIGAAL